ncbi:response regulator [Phaeobacter sp. QD34_3]|uniref:ATP-binding protein n=1 Tax=unclassified Phaeobacter TaxID=2621772 RepID=UPI00237F5C4D|nr:MULTISPECIES: ATP-binding protein [unclassified Phaeobacter]MDE4134523.1 response regulator [Phaeobacter sp. QD34_3]MDE4138182.1 response regulator [Phaeobacter sp. QD34_24]
MRKTQHHVLDILALISMVGVILSLVRISQVGVSYMIVGALLFGLCVLPSIIWRSDKYLMLRGFLLVAGYLSAISLGMANLGLASTGVGALPFILAIWAFIFSRKSALIFFAAIVVGMACFGFLFTNGVLSSPQITISQWNQDPRSWVVATWALIVCSLIVLTLIFNLRAFWVDTDAEAEQKNSQLIAMVEFSPDAIVIFDLDAGQVAAVNRRAEELFGISRDDLENAPMLEKQCPERQPSGDLSADVVRQHMDKALDGAHPVFNLEILNAEGEAVFCEISLSRIPPTDRTLMRANISDISNRLAEQKQREDLQSSLAASQRREAIGQLTGGVAHDFNNILAIIMGNLELLRERVEDEELEVIINGAISASERGAGLTRSLLAFAHEARLQPEVVDLNTIVHEAEKWMRRTLPASIVVEISLLAGLWPVKLDRTSLESALLNLILNARDAMQGHGRLTIETANIRLDETYLDARGEEIKPGRYVMLAVSDTGTGIDPEILERMFDPFFTTKPPGSGSGVGLSMVQGFVQQSLGTVQVYSETAVGTTLKLYFPVSDTALPAKAEESPVQADRNAGAGRILLAEDQEQVRALLLTILQTGGYEVTAASTGDAAFEIFQSDPTFDLVVTDIVMPGDLQGTDLAKRIRETHPDTPFIFMSGYAAEATVHGNGLRPEDVRLMKPVPKADLLKAVATMLRKTG